MLRKDQQLLNLLDSGFNIANFVCFTPDCYLISSTLPNRENPIETLLKVAASRKVNIRTFTLERHNNNPFYMGLDDPKTIWDLVIELTSKGYYVIVNELIPLDDGGFSGVAMGDYVEVAPGDTPRCVEKPGVMQCSMDFLEHLIYTIYHVDLDEDEGFNSHQKRVEFSFHPYKCGVLKSHIIIWESIDTKKTPDPPLFPSWPNRFSEAMGDKVFGIMVAHYFRDPVPYSFVISKTLPVFGFGCREYNSNYWSRTAPRVNTPGEYPTVRGFLSPFMIANVDELSSMIYQNEIDGEFSGAAIYTNECEPVIIEGVPGFGDGFMMGTNTVDLPDDVLLAVKKTVKTLSRQMGHPIKIEWVIRDSNVFILQLNLLRKSGTLVKREDVVNPRFFNISHYKDSETAWVAFNNLVKDTLTKGVNNTIVVVGDVGITSHYGDLLRQNNINYYFHK